MYKQYYSEFLKGHQNKIHMAGHSHHFWPDVSKAAHQLAWEKSRDLSDQKWDYQLGELLPEVQKIISNIINFPRPSDIAFAPNTHELIIKLISCFFSQDKIKILTTTDEFHSLSRQLKRFGEDAKFEISYIDTNDPDIQDSLNRTLNSANFDLIIMSHVFFNTGKILENNIIEKIITLKGDALFALDAYHGFCAIPTDISKFSDDIFYLAGGYKYAQAGEGMCFMTLPKNCKLTPQITGWFASFESLESPLSETTKYANNGMRFWGSTIDMTSFYRFRAVWNNFFMNGIDVQKLHKYTKSLQMQFLNNNKLASRISNQDLDQIGSFITVKFDSADQAKSFYEELSKNGILTDYRGSHLRFGFTPYLEQEDIEQVKTLINSL